MQNVHKSPTEQYFSMFLSSAAARGVKDKTLQTYKQHLSGVKIDLRTVVFQYKDDAFAEIHAHFDDNVKIKAYLSADVAFTAIESVLCSTTKNDIKQWLAPRYEPLPIIVEAAKLFVKNMTQRHHAEFALLQYRS